MSGESAAFLAPPQGRLSVPSAGHSHAIGDYRAISEFLLLFGGTGRSQDRYIRNVLILN